MLERPPLSLYIHIPWCIRKCPYCDFNSHQLRDDLPESEYVRALSEDIRLEADTLQDNDQRRLHSIFIGGGTPSLFSASAIAEILQCAEQAIGFESAIEITLEANPGASEAQRFADYRKAGVNRLSIGIQSFQDDKLVALGRVHDSNEAKQAIESCLLAGFNNFNLDLMHGLPGQDIEGALSDLEQAIHFNPTHLSWYQLTVEPNTEFHNRPPVLPEDSSVFAMQDAGYKMIADAGFKRYEVSAYAKPGKESRHNLNYWEYGDYLGVGAGAHGKQTLLLPERIVRSRKRKLPGAYVADQINRTVERNEVTENERPFEYLMNALRLGNGFSITEFEKRTGVTFSAIRKRVEYLSSQDLLTQQNGQITTTEHGFRVLNSVLEEFLDNDGG